MTKRIFVAGHKGMVGRGLVRRLSVDRNVELILKDRGELDLCSQVDVQAFFQNEKIDEVYLAAAKVGGIHANSTYPAQFIYENLTIQTNVIHAAHLADIEKLLFLGSSCIYPKEAQQPISEDALLTGPLEPTNEPYAVAKIAGIKMCEGYNRQYGRDFRSVMPTNLYGPFDNFHLENSHVVPALIRRFHAAVRYDEREIVVWGSGTPRREFLHVDDMAEMSVSIMNLSKEVFSAGVTPGTSHVNVGFGEDVSIRDLAQTIGEISGFSGKLVFDSNKPDGTMRKLLDVSRSAALELTAHINLKDGLRETFDWYHKYVSDVRS